MSGILSLVRSVVRQEVDRRRAPALGVITAVFPHTSDDGDTAYDVSLALKSDGLEIRRVPVAVPFSGFAAPLRPGDPVLVQFLNGELNQPVVTGFVYHAEDRPPLHQEEEVLLEHRVNDGTRNHLRFAADGSIFLQRDVKKLEDNSDAQTSVKIDGGSGDVEIKVGSDITITMSGDKVSIKGNVEIEGDLTVKGDVTVEGAAGSTKISGNTIEGT